MTVLAEAWLEVYSGSARSGERLVYETAEPGKTYSFRAPVYIFSGNAGGVSGRHRGHVGANPWERPWGSSRQVRTGQTGATVRPAEMGASGRR